VVSGFPVVPNTQWKREIASLPKLPDLIKQVKKLETRLNAME
jgi:UDP-3-O-[3-hydroxymyristoyl] glucosamine N-acyltransferase